MPELFSCPAAAPILGALVDRDMTGDSIRSLARRGQLGCVRRGRRIFIPLSALEAFAASWPTRERHSKLRRREWGLRCP